MHAEILCCWKTFCQKYYVSGEELQSFYSEILLQHKSAWPAHKQVSYFGKNQLFWKKRSYWHFWKKRFFWNYLMERFES